MSGQFDGRGNYGRQVDGRGVTTVLRYFGGDIFVECSRMF